MARLRLPGLGGWDEDPLWGSIYDWSVEHPVVGGALWRIGAGTELKRLYQAVDEIGRQPAGAAILDVPVGGGVALRGLRKAQGVRYVAADISQLMLDRTMAKARELGVADQVTPVIADVHQLRFDDSEFDLVVSMTGLHCFPDPHQALLELGRVTRPGGRITGSTLIRGSLRSDAMQALGRKAGLAGPGVTADEVRTWTREAGFTDVRLEMSGVMGYFRGIRR